MCSINKQHKETIRELGGLEPMIRVISSTDAETKRYGLRCLYNTTLNGASPCMLVVEVWGGAVVADRLVLFARTETNASQIIVIGGTADVLRCVQDDDMDAKLYAISTLQNLAGVPAGEWQSAHVHAPARSRRFSLPHTGKVDLRKRGAIPSLLKQLDAAHDTRVIAAVLKTLSTLATNGTCS